MAIQTIPLAVVRAGNNPADSTSYFYALYDSAVGNADGWGAGYHEAPYSGTITAISFMAKTTVISSGEDVTFAVRINDTTDIASSTEARWDVAFETWTVTGLSQAISAGDLFALKVVTPAWVTNPTTASVSALVFLEASAGAAPVAAFSATPLSGTAPLTVQFTDESTNTPTSWSWDFGDGETSTSQNPSHTYTLTGTFTVELTATNATGSDDEIKTGYITITEAARGNAGAIFASWESGRQRKRTEEEVHQDRERFGLPAKVDAAIEEVAALQARQEEMDAAAAEQALREELKLKRIQFRTKYLEALAARMEANLQAVQAQQIAAQQQRNAQIIRLIAAAAVS